MAIIHRVRAVSTGWTGGPGLNTFYFREGAGTVADAAVAQLGADRVRAAFVEMQGIYPNGHSIVVDPVVDALEDTTGTLVNSFGVTPPAAVPGIGGPGYGPLPSMLLASLITSGVVAGSRVAGRAYLGPILNSVEGNGTPTAGQLAAVTAFGVAMRNAGPTGPALVVWSRPFPGQVAPLTPKPARLGSSHAVTAITARDFFAVLRSRRD